MTVFACAKGRTGLPGWSVEATAIEAESFAEALGEVLTEIFSAGAERVEVESKGWTKRTGEERSEVEGAILRYRLKPDGDQVKVVIARSGKFTP
jgi:hypothetical protein